MQNEIYFLVKITILDILLRQISFYIEKFLKKVMKSS